MTVGLKEKAEGINTLIPKYKKMKSNLLVQYLSET